MAQPTPPKKLSTPFASDKNKKRKMLAAAGGVIFVIFLATFIQSRKKKEDPATAMAANGDAVAKAQVESPAQGNKPVAMQEGAIQNPAVMNPQAQDEPFLKQMQEFRKQQDQQKAAEQQAREAKAREEAQRIANGQTGSLPANGNLPPGVNPDGTARTAQQQQQQQQAQVQATREKVEAPPLAGYDTTAWVELGGARYRPGWQTGSQYPVDPAEMKRYEDRWNASFGAEMVPGVDPHTNTRMQRLKQDYSGVQAATPKRPIQVRGTVPGVRTAVPATGDAAGWGSWITVRPANPGEATQPQQKAPEAKPASTTEGGH